MTSSIQHMDHPVNMYIRGQVGITVEQFGQIAGIPQSTLTTWVQRKRRVEKLPIYFYAALADVAKQSISEVYQAMLNLQHEYDRYLYETAKKADQTIFNQAAYEGRAVKASYAKKRITEQLISPSKQLVKALNEEDKLMFLEALLLIYSQINRAIPKWITDYLKDKESFNEFGRSFYNTLIA